MNKHSIIVIIASIVIVVTLGFTVLSFFAINQLQFKTADKDGFSYFDLIHDKKISLCNPTPFYAKINEIKIELFYQEKNKGMLSFQGVVLEPTSDSIFEGKFSSETFEEMQYLSMHYDGMFSGSTPIRIDPTELVIVYEINSSIIGFFPVSVVNQYSGLEFWEIMNRKDVEYSC